MAAAALASLVGCTSPGDAASAEAVVAIARSPATAVHAIVDVYARGADTVQVHYADDHGVGGDTPALPVTGTPTSVPLFGLTPGATTRVDVTLRTRAGVAAAPTLSLSTPPLPAGFPNIQVTTNRLAGDDRVLLSILGNTLSLAAIIDRAGRLLWYRLGDSPSILGFDFQRWPGGELTLYRVGWLGFEELDFTDGLLREWSVSTPLGLDGHDFQLLPNGHALALARGLHAEDTRARVDGGAADAGVLDVTVVELDGKGGVVPRWASWPAVTLDEVAPDIDLAAQPIDALHPNSLVQLDDGGWLVSLRHTDTVLRIDPDGAIRWRLGGRKSDFRFVGDPFGGFSHQHDVRMLPDGNLLLLDNGNLHTPQVSRAVEYQLDEAAHTATEVWEYRHHPDLNDWAAGSAQRMANGDTLISWGIDGVVTQVDAHGEVDWEMTVGDNMVYRAIAVDSLY